MGLIEGMFATGEDIAPPSGVLTMGDGRTIKVFLWEPHCECDQNTKPVTVKIEGWIQRKEGE